MSKSKYKRVLIKISGEVLADEKNSISNKASEDIAKKIKKIVDMGVEVALVVGAGNIFRGISGAANGFDRVTADTMGMLGIVINSLALQQAMQRIGLKSRVMSALQMPEVAEYYIRDKAVRHLNKGRVLILAAGIGRPYVTSDSGASLRALELGCEVVMKATKVDGVFDKDPVKHPDAKKYETLSLATAIENDNIQIMDKGALSMCRDNGMAIQVFKLFEGDNLIKAVQGEHIGTYLAKGAENKLV